ncbi:hypothetical protein [Pseudomonas phage GP100]|nr:hypothetical protein [Pseudomonas phage GP100]
MKAMIVVMMLALVGCGSIKQEPQRVNDTRWSDHIHDTMIECGEVASKIAGKNPELADALFNQCVRDVNITI